ncbi:hypothetical protein [Amycolatopsis mongoliensis]|uniref:hypothetical protein n=1 Tax=Amycolatopsis mongoliensis TaxID=715475 RepID=UPI0038CC09C2
MDDVDHPRDAELVDAGTEMFVPGVWSIPVGVSAAISLKPFSATSWACMIFSASAPSGDPNSPNVFTVRVPPKMHS